MRYIFIIMLVVVWMGGCNTAKNGGKTKDDTPRIPERSNGLGYEFNRPTETQELPIDLTEISGLGMGTDGYPIAIQDEKGSIFRITPDSVYEYPFRKEGDYEGIEQVGEVIYVVKNTGTIYEVTELNQEKPKVDKHKNFLNDDYDIEGLCYDAQSKGLLLACKRDGDLEKNERGIFRFDLENHELDTVPFLVLNVKDIYEQIAKNAEGHKAFQKMLKEAEEEDPVFAPSAIAIHPHSGQIYLTSSRGKLLVVVERDGKVVHVEKLDKNIHKQPEGLTFDKDGHLYISNEGKDGKGTVYKVKWMKK